MMNDPLLKKYILIPLIALGVLLSVIGLLGYQLMDMKTQSETQNAELKKTARSLIQDVRFLRRQQALYQQFGEEYESVIQNGLVKTFDRVKWVDALLRFKNELVMTPFTMQFEPQQKLEKAQFSSFKFKRNIFYYTRMNLTVGFQSDYDLITLNQLMTDKVSPLYSLEECDLKHERNPELNALFNPINGSITAKCSYVIFQAKPREAKQK